jgi:hypothetical protein
MKQESHHDRIKRWLTDVAESLELIKDIEKGLMDLTRESVPLVICVSELIYVYHTVRQ